MPIRVGRGLGLQRRGTAVVVLCLVQFVDVLGVTVVIAALPTMLEDLDASRAAAGPVVTAYAMFFGGLLLLGARLGDRYGHRRVLLLGLATFGAASVFAATSFDVAALVAARCLQGGAAALSVPSALRLLTDVADTAPAKRRALSGWSAAGAAAGASGFVLGGVVTEWAGWQLIFWANVPLALTLIAAIRYAVPDTAGRRSERLDVLGAVLLVSAVMALVVGAAVVEEPQHRVLGLIVLLVGAALVLMFLQSQRQRAAPLLPEAARRDRNLLVGAASAFVNTATTSSAMALATLHLQRERGLGPSAAGLSLLPFSLAVVAGAATAAPILRRWRSSSALCLGLCIIAVGTAALLAVTAATWVAPLAVGISGFGLGVSSVASTSIGMDVGAAVQGTASGLLNTAAQLGTALGVAGLLLLASATAGDTVFVSGDKLAWVVAALIATASGAVIVIADRATKRGSGDDSAISAPGNT